MIKCAQLDLARQMESVPFIEQFVDILADNGYNALHLYLEDRIRTKSYPYSAADDSYSPEEMRHIVAYAKKRGVEVFPCVATLGHAERFLKHKELEHLAELQGDMKGRFGGSQKMSFCPSNPDVMKFLEKYLAEVAEIFPSKYFHAGLDEVWDFVLCEKCRKNAPNAAAEGELFLKHVIKVHDCLKKLGKRMMMWTDMIEFYPEILEKLPRDIIMNDWQYQGDVRALKDHFNNSKQTSLAKYDALGFDVWMCCAERYYSNGVTAFQYASRFKCTKGFMVTSWEKSDTYIFRTLPIFAALGRVMCGEQPDVAFDKGVDYLFPNPDAVFLAAMRFTADNIFPRHYESSSDCAIFSRDCGSLPFRMLSARQMCRVAFERASNGVDASSLAGLVLMDLMNTTLECIRSYEMNIAAITMIEEGFTKERLAAFKGMCANYMQLYREREEQWDAFRKDIPNLFATALEDVQKRLEGFAKALKEKRFVRLRLTHDDWYGINGLRVFLRNNGEWCKIGEIVPKPCEIDHTNSMELYMPIPKKELLNADAIRIEYFGYGGCGVCHACIFDDAKMLKAPKAIISATGEVEHTEYILDDDSKFAFIGSQDMRRTYIHKELYDTGTSVELLLF